MVGLRDVVGGYELVGVLGTGGMATVYHGRHTKSGQTAAVKVAHPGVGEGMIQRFLMEGRLGLNVQHPALVKVEAYGRHRETAFIVMEWVKGVELTSLLDDPMFDLKGRLSVLEDIAGALSALHRHDILHRDIKPANVVVQHDGRARLLDLGIAKTRDVNYTQPGHIVGSIHALPPESLLGLPVDARADVFQLAVLAFRLFGQGCPWEGTHPAQLAYAILHHPPRALSLNFRSLLSVDESVLFRLEQIIAQGLSKEPDERPESVGAFVAALRDAVLRAEYVVLGSAWPDESRLPPGTAYVVQHAEQALSLLLENTDRQLVVTSGSDEYEVANLQDALCGYELRRAPIDLRQ